VAHPGTCGAFLLQVSDLGAVRLLRVDISRGNVYRMKRRVQRA
jgi:hypothetical protein